MTSLIFLLSLPSFIEAHNGSRDELGGHFRTNDCYYLLHEPTELAKSANNKQELVELIKKYNSNTTCKSTFNEEKLDVEGYSFNNSSEPTQSEEIQAPNSDDTNELELGKTYSATLEKCTDGDTANFIINDTTYKTRFLYIDTPESTNTVEPFGKEASEFTCQFLKQGKITIETDGPSLFDKYDRLLAWVWVDEQLHQEVITEAGLVEKFYDYGDYKYEERLIAAMEEAKEQEKGLYASEQSEQVENVTKNQPDHNSESPKDTKSNDTEGNTEETEEPTQSEIGLVIFAAILLLLFFWLPTLKSKAGVKLLIVHRLRTKKVWLNLLLAILYLAFWYLLLIVVLIELIHLVINLKIRAK